MRRKYWCLFTFPCPCGERTEERHRYFRAISCGPAFLGNSRGTLSLGILPMGQTAVNQFEA